MEAPAVVLLDGGYIGAILRNEFALAKIDYLRLSDEISEGYHRFRTYYYDCLPYQGDPATEQERQMVSGKQKFFTMLESLPRFDVRLGKLRKRGTEFVQKGSIFC